MSAGTNPKDLVGARKAPLSVVPMALVIGAAEAGQNGVEKYGAFNWREYPVQVMTYIEAMQRHLAAFVDGQDLAEDTGIHHLKHVAAGVGILLDSIALGIAVDNRPPKGPAADLLRLQDKSAKSNEVLTLVAGNDPVCDHGPGPSMEHICRIMAQGTIITAEEWGVGDGDVFGTSGFLADADEVYSHGTPGAFDCNVPDCTVQGHHKTGR